jgi:acetyl-CoA acetyltransferase
VAIVGLGITEVGKVYGRTSADFAAEAVSLAVADAGLTLGDVDGLLVSAGIDQGVHLGLQRDLAIPNLRVLTQVSGAGSTAVQQLEYASQLVANGDASVVVCAHGDAPLVEGGSASGSYQAAARRRRGSLVGIDALPFSAGMSGPNAGYAMAARRHMSQFGTTSEQLGAVAVAQRAWAQRNPIAQMRGPMTIEDHQRSRFVVEPLHLFDCCLVSNGGIAYVVTSVERARTLAKPPVYVWGWGQSHPGYQMERGSEFGLISGAALSGPAAMKMAGVSPSDVEVCEIYDCYTYTVMVTLEDYGFCAKGEGGPFVASGVLGPGGALPTNTGGGELSGYYLWGMTPMSEAIIQARGDGGERQVERHDVVLVSGNGGTLDYHATAVLSPQPRS